MWRSGCGEEWMWGEEVWKWVSGCEEGVGVG